MSIHQGQRLSFPVVGGIYEEDHADGGKALGSGACQERVGAENQGVVSGRSGIWSQAEHVAHGRAHLHHRGLHADDKLGRFALANRRVGNVRLQHDEMHPNTTATLLVGIVTFHRHGFLVGDTTPFERVDYNTVFFYRCQGGYGNKHLYLCAGTVAATVYYSDGYGVCLRNCASFRIFARAGPIDVRFTQGTAVSILDIIQQIGHLEGAITN